MSFVPFIAGSSAATTAAAAAAARNRRRLMAEEERMTPYGKEDLEGWEFKIVRAATNKFKDPGVVRTLCEEEALAGWEMLEKFDNSRIRFKRRIEHRSTDHHAEIDPYRTQYGIGGTAHELRIAGIIAGVIGLIVLLGGVIFTALH